MHIPVTAIVTNRHGQELLGCCHVEPVQLPGPELAALTGRAFAAAAAGELRPVIGQAFSLEHAAAAHRAIESRQVFGKTLLAVTQ